MSCTHLGTLLGSSFCVPSLDVTSDSTDANPAVVLWAHLSCNTKPSELFLNAFLVLPHIHAGPVNIFTVLDLNKQLPAWLGHLSSISAVYIQSHEHVKFTVIRWSEYP